MTAEQMTAEQMMVVPVRFEQMGAKEVGAEPMIAGVSAAVPEIVRRLTAEPVITERYDERGHVRWPARTPIDRSSPEERRSSRFGPPHGAN
jgi:hypothetical protein